MSAFIAAVTLIVAAPVDAQTLTGPQQISWVAPSTLADGRPIPATVALTYNLYAKLAGAAEVKLLSNAATTTHTMAPMPVGQINCYMVAVLVNGANESDRSAEGCGPVLSPKAGKVTTLVIQ